MSKKSISIQNKLNFVLIAIVTILLLGFGVYDILETKNNLLVKLEKKSEEVTSSLAKEIAFALWEIDEKLADELLQYRMESNPDIVSVVVLDMDGKTEFASKYCSISGSLLNKKSGEDVEEARFTHSRDVVYEDRIIGYITVGMTDANINKQIKTFAIEKLIRILIIDILLIAFLTFFIRKILIRPLQVLESQIRLFSAGRFNNIKYVESNDEIGLISKTFKNMVLELRATTVSRNDMQSEIEERKRLEKVLKQERNKAIELRDVAQAAAKAKSDFLANMSHEIRTPMNAILGFGDLLAKSNLDEKQKMYLKSVQSSGQLLIGIIDDILDISKLESGHIQLESIDVNVEELVHDVFRMIVTRVKNGQFDTYVDMADDIPKVVKADPTRLKQILVNLLGNAIKFTPEGEIGVLVRRSPQQSDDDRVHIEFTVKDTGIGIPEDKVNRIFESFTQADESTTREYGGTGLGLAITKALVETMGGNIRVESKLEEGSSFIFSIPLMLSDVPVKDETQSDAAQSFKNKTVFIVDDNQTSLKIVERCCEKLDLKIIGVSQSPNEALHKLDKVIKSKDMVPDIILSDLMMDGMSGFQLVEKIKRNTRFKDTVFIAVTADIKAETDHDPQKQVFNAYVTKPVSIQSLVYSFNSVMGPNVDVDSVKSDSAIKSCEGVKVLVVEDVIPNQMLIGEYFKQLGCEVTFANNGQEAVDQLRKSADYDLCLMDLQMPVMGGIEATEVIRKEITQDLPIVALTAAILEEDKSKALEVGMNDFLAKPIHIDKLKEVVLRYKKAA